MHAGVTVGLLHAGAGAGVHELAAYRDQRTWTLTVLVALWLPALSVAR